MQLPATYGTVESKERDKRAGVYTASIRESATSDHNESKTK